MYACYTFVARFVVQARLYWSTPYWSGSVDQSIFSQRGCFSYLLSRNEEIKQFGGHSFQAFLNLVDCNSGNENILLQKGTFQCRESDFVVYSIKTEIVTFMCSAWKP